MKKRFQWIIAHTLKWEGGETVDTGGYTKYGISQKAYPHLDIKSMTLDEAKDIYFHDYYTKGPEFVDSGIVAVKYFDLCVNMGVKRATKVLQKASNRTNFVQPPLNRLVVDGEFGDKTENHVNATSPGVLSWLLVEAGMYYNKLARRDKYKPYLHGWLNRLYDFPERY